MGMGRVGGMDGGGAIGGFLGLEGEEGLGLGVRATDRALARALAPVTVGDEECRGSWLHSAARKWLVTQGWQIVHVNLKDWQRMGPGARQRWISEALRKIGPAGASHAGASFIGRVSGGESPYQRYAESRQ